MNLYEILGFQPKGVATLSFSSRERPDYAGMTLGFAKDSKAYLVSLFAALASTGPAVIERRLSVRVV